MNQTVESRRLAAANANTESWRRFGPYLSERQWGIFDDDRYFDVFVEYAKAEPEDILMRVTVHNRGPEAATIHLLPQLWFRNTWSWKPDVKKPIMREENGSVFVEHGKLGEFRLHVSPHPDPLPRGEGTAKVDPQNSKAHSLRPQTGVDSPSPGGEGRGEGERLPTFLFCDNETNARRLYGQRDAQGFFKDGFDEYVVHGNQATVNCKRTGTKAGALYKLTIPAGKSTKKVSKNNLNTICSVLGFKCGW